MARTKVYIVALTASIVACSTPVNEVSSPSAPSETSQPTSSTTSSSSTTTSSTVPRVRIPDLRGYDREQAAEVLQSLGLFARFVEKPDSAKTGTVIDLPFGIEANPGSTVEVRVATPLLHDFEVTYDVRANEWSNISGDRCEHRDLEVERGKSVTLKGPDGDLLSAVIVDYGTVRESPPNYWVEGYDGRICRFTFTFTNIPEVATYLFSTQAGVDFPVISLEDAKNKRWQISFGYGPRS